MMMDRVIATVPHRRRRHCCCVSRVFHVLCCIGITMLSLLMLFHFLYIWITPCHKVRMVLVVEIAPCKVGRSPAFAVDTRDSLHSLATAQAHGRLRVAVVRTEKTAAVRLLSAAHELCLYWYTAALQAWTAVWTPASARATDALCGYECRLCKIHAVSIQAVVVQSLQLALMR